MINTKDCLTINVKRHLIHPEDYKGVSGSLDEVQGRGEGEGEGEGEAQFCETFWQENKANN